MGKIEVLIGMRAAIDLDYDRSEFSNTNKELYEKRSRSMAIEPASQSKR